MLSPSLFESTSFLTVLVPPDREADTFAYDPADLLAIVEDFERYTQGEDANEAGQALQSDETGQGTSERTGMRSRSGLC